MIFTNKSFLRNLALLYILKLSGEALQGKQEYGIEVEFLENLAKDIVYLVKNKKIEIVIVIGGGNIFRGVSGAAKGLDRGTADYMGMLATVMNGLPYEMQSKETELK